MTMAWNWLVAVSPYVILLLLVNLLIFGGLKLSIWSFRAYVQHRAEKVGFLRFSPRRVCDEIGEPWHADHPDHNVLVIPAGPGGIYVLQCSGCTATQYVVGRRAGQSLRVKRTLESVRLSNEARILADIAAREAESPSDIFVVFSPDSYGEWRVDIWSASSDRFNVGDLALMRCPPDAPEPEPSEPTEPARARRRLGL